MNPEVFLKKCSGFLARMCRPEPHFLQFSSLFTLALDVRKILCLLINMLEVSNRFGFILFCDTFSKSFLKTTIIENIIFHQNSLPEVISLGGTCSSVRVFFCITGEWPSSWVNFNGEVHCGMMEIEVKNKDRAKIGSAVKFKDPDELPHFRKLLTGTPQRAKTIFFFFLPRDSDAH